MDLRYRRFEKSAIAPLHQAFVDAFSDYFVSFSPPLDQFKTRIEDKLNIHSDLSLLAWDHERVAGFILHTLNEYENKRTIYNGGTGVVPAFRGHQLASRIYHRILREIDTSVADRVILEAVENNYRAIKVYESLGFRYAKTFLCFKLKTSPPERTTPVSLKASHTLKAEYEAHFDFSPSFLDCSVQLQYNLAHEIVLEAWYQEILAGHIVFQPQLGRISQLGVAPSYRRMGIATRLIAAAFASSTGGELTVMNIPAGERGMISTLEHLGFQNELNQIELELIL